MDNRTYRNETHKQEEKKMRNIFNKVNQWLFNFNDKRTKPINLLVIHGDYFVEVYSNPIGMFDQWDDDYRYHYVRFEQLKNGSWVSCKEYLSSNIHYA